MQDWGQYIERPYKEVLEELRAEGYQVVGDDFIACYRNVDLQKGDARIRLVCVPFDLDDFDDKLNDKEKTYELDNVEWYTFEIYDEEGVMLAGNL
ncbi:MAG: hypothetical protein IJ142_04315 [Bacteroidaceae bacterium]|nr:hypothetical protein [Bacteroidaceae bacterium]